MGSEPADDRVFCRDCGERIGTLRRIVRDDGLTSLPADDVAYILDVIERYDRVDGTIDTVHVRQRIDALLEE